jgi:hypothetical protein
MESVTFIESPARLHHARDFTLAGQFAEADAANPEPPNVRAPAAAVLATVVFPRRELGWPTLLYFPSQFRHNSIL